MNKAFTISFLATILIVGGGLLALASCSKKETSVIDRVPNKKPPPLVEVVDVGTCDGGMCLWKTPAGSTIIVMRDTSTVHGGGMKASEPGKITIGGGDTGFLFENFTITAEEAPTK